MTEKRMKAELSAAKAKVASLAADLYLAEVRKNEIENKQSEFSGQVKLEYVYEDVPAGPENHDPVKRHLLIIDLIVRRGGERWFVDSIHRDGFIFGRVLL